MILLRKNLIGPGRSIPLRNLFTTSQDPLHKPLVTSLPAKAYTDPIFYEKERRGLLGNNWQLIAHESQLPFDKTIPASYLAETICNYPTILVRSGKTGEIKGYHNICRHRAGPLEWDGTKGSCSIHGLKCKYHGWTYSLDGELRGVPAFQQSSSTCSSEPLKKGDYNLWPMRVAVWRGLVFIQQLPPKTVTSSTDQDLAMSGESANAAFVKDNQAFCDRMTSVPLESFQVHRTSTHYLKCNWKVYVENYLEGYHIPTIHPLLNSQVDMNDYTVHVQEKFIEHTTTTRASNYEGVWVWLSPTLAINWYGTGLSLERIVPTGPDTTEIRYIFMIRNTQQSDYDANLKELIDAMEVSRIVTDEDIQICETVYAALKSGGYTSPGKLSPRHENGVEYFQKLVSDSHLME